ncbi:MAG: DNA polymerase Y family protein [Actinomycetota bacterium]
MSERRIAVGCPRWAIVAADLPPDAAAAVFFANRVVSASPEAVAFGIRRGMRRREAQARCPEVEVLAHDPARDARTFEKIVSVVESFSPRVEVVRPGLCVLASRGPARYFGGEDALRQRVADAVDDTIDIVRVHPLHLDDRARTGIADGSFAAALAAARSTVVPPGGSRAFLAGFLVDVLDQPELCDLLRRLGLRRLGDLAKLPAGRVGARFGAEGVIAHRLARGDGDRLLEPRVAPPELTVTRELDPPAHRVDIAMFAGKAAADELAGGLAALGLACAKLAITACTEHGEERMRVWRYSAAFTPAAIAERVRWQLEGWLQEGGLTGGISIIRLTPEDVGPAHGSAVGFWGRRGDVSDRVRRAVARVQGLLGPDGARQPTLQGGRHPSEQVRAVPWGDPVEPERAGLPGTKTVAGPVEVELPPWPGQLPAPAPTVVYDQPPTAEVLDDNGSPVGVSGRFAATSVPSRVRLSGRGAWTDVVSWAGPWPADERWWDPAGHRRRARFQIALADGTAHLLALEEGEWQLEATYD